MNKYIQRLYRESMKFNLLRHSLIGAYNLTKENPVLNKNEHSYFSDLDVVNTLAELKKNALSQTFKISEELLEEIINQCKINLAYPSLRFDGISINNSKGQIIDYNNPKSFEKDCIWYAYKDIRQWEALIK